MPAERTTGAPPPPAAPSRRSVVATSSQEPPGEREPPSGIPDGGTYVRTAPYLIGGAGQYTLTPYAFRASTTGWKKVVPPEEQLPLPPEVRPIARVPE